MTNSSSQSKKQHMLGKDALFKKWFWENWMATRTRLKQDAYLLPHTKINSRWIKHLSERHEILTLIQENIGKPLVDIGLSNEFMIKTPNHVQQQQK